MSDQDRFIFAGVIATVVTLWIKWIAAELSAVKDEDKE